MSAFRSIRPADGKLLGTFPVATPSILTETLDRSHRAFLLWRGRRIEERVAYLLRVGERLRAEVEPLSLLMADEMGKPVREGRSEVLKCAWMCDWIAENGPELLADRPAEMDDAEAWVSYRPIGGVLGVMPWNFPLWQVVRFAAPALLAGNTVVLKHAPNVPGCAEALERVFHDPGVPDGVFSSLRVEVEALSSLLDHEHIRAATLTGSTRAGRSFAQQTGSRLLPTVLELGGSDAVVVLEDADIEVAAEACAASRLLNGGQSCIAAKRIIVVGPIYDRFLQAFIAAMARRKMGDPRSEDTDLGPMAREDLRSALHEQVLDTVAAGARLLLGGELPSGPGSFYPATVVSEVPLNSRMAVEEVFGPAAAVFQVRDEAEAIRLANATAFGLGAAVFTADRQRGRRIAQMELEAGSCFVNGFVKSDPRLPFGGIKDSGFGRELGPEGVRAFCNIKTLWIDGS